MCTPACVQFGRSSVTPDEVKNKKVIEIGSYDVNGSFKSFMKNWEPEQYLGVDIENGPGVDLVCSADDVLSRFGKEAFDIVISTELLEHVKDWRLVISNMKNICKPNGIILITTRSFGFPFHGYPYDFWRYEMEDMKTIFSDCIIEKLEKDSGDPGVFLKVRKPANFTEKDLSKYDLFSILSGQKTSKVDEDAFNRFRNQFRLKIFIHRIHRFVHKYGKLFKIKLRKMSGQV
ncbi:MAG: methyltransferase domain-containing protein [Phycisphaerae bacterium]